MHNWFGIRIGYQSDSDRIPQPLKSHFFFSACSPRARLVSTIIYAGSLEKKDFSQQIPQKKKPNSSPKNYSPGLNILFLFWMTFFLIFFDKKYSVSVILIYFFNFKF